MTSVNSEYQIKVVDWKDFRTTINSKNNGTLFSKMAYHLMNENIVQGVFSMKMNVN